MKASVNEEDVNTKATPSPSLDTVGPAHKKDSSSQGFCIFFRCWHGFTDSFPFDEFNKLAEDQIIPAIEAYARRWWEDNETFARKQIESNRVKVEEAIKRRENHILFSPKSSVKTDTAQKLPAHLQSPAEGEIPSTSVIVRIAGWYFADQFAELSPSDRRLIAKVSDEGAAQTLVKVMQGRFDMYGVSESVAHVMLRFGYLPVNDIPASEYALNKMSIQDIINGISDEALDAFYAPVLKERDKVLEAMANTVLLEVPNISRPSQCDKEKPAKASISKKPRGRPTNTDHVRDRRWYDGWQTGEHKRFADFAAVLSTEDEPISARAVQRAVERHQKRLKRSAQNQVK